MIPEHDWLKKWAFYTPNVIALKDADSGAQVNYREFFDASNRLARFLRDRYGVRYGDRIAVLAMNEIEYIFLFFALQRLGAILVPINFRLTAPEMNHILKDCAPKVLVHQRRFQSVVDQVDRSAMPQFCLHFDGDDSLTSAAHDSRLSSEYLPLTGAEQSKCMILYTSGTTGAPKGAVITLGMVFWNSINTTLRLNVVQSDRTLAFLPFFHTGGWNVLTTPFLHRGAQVILLKKFDPERVLELCEKERVTVLFGVPTMLDMMYHTPRFEQADVRSLRYAIVGGEPMPIELIRIWQEKGIPIRQGFGMTEFGPNVFSLPEEDSLRKIGSIGSPNFYIEAKLVDDDGHEVGVDEVGELILKGPVCTPGYWNNPEATASAIKDGWYYSGDLLKKDAEGYYFVVGRKKDMYISGGENVYPAEVEKVLRTHAAIHEVAVIGVPDEKWGEVGKAFVSLKKPGSASPEELIAYCQDKLAKFKIPRYVQFLSELPKGDSGKILKRALKELSLPQLHATSG